MRSRATSSGRPAVRALVAAAALGVAADAGAFSTASVRFFGTGGGTAVDRIRVPVDPPAPADVGAGDFTVELWLRGTLAANVAPSGGFFAPGQTESSGGDWIYGNIVVDRDLFGAGPDWGMSVHRAGGEGVLRFGTETAGGQAHTLQGTVPVLDGTWHHVAFVREAASGVKRIYVDGVLDVQSASGVAPGDLSHPDGRPTAYPDSDPFLVFAAEKHGFAATSGFPSFAGWLDEIRVWSVARSAAAIAADRDRVLPGSTPGLVLALRLEEGSGTALTDATGGNVATLHAGVAGNGEWSAEVPPSGAATTTTSSSSSTTTDGGSTTTTSTTLPPAALDVPLPLRAGVVRAGRLVRFSARPSLPVPVPAAGSADDPTLAGAALRVVDLGGAAGDDTYELPGGGWRGLGRPAGRRGWRWEGGGACAVVVVTAKAVRAVCREGIAVVPPFAGEAAFVLSVGTRRYCGQLGGTVVKNERGVFRARNAGAPAGCPAS